MEQLGTDSRRGSESQTFPMKTFAKCPSASFLPTAGRSLGGYAVSEPPAKAAAGLPTPGVLGAGVPGAGKRRGRGEQRRERLPQAPQLEAGWVGGHGTPYASEEAQVCPAKTPQCQEPETLHQLQTHKRHAESMLPLPCMTSAASKGTGVRRRSPGLRHPTFGLFWWLSFHRPTARRQGREDRAAGSLLPTQFTGGSGPGRRSKVTWQIKGMPCLTPFPSVMSRCHSTCFSPLWHAKEA